MEKSMTELTIMCPVCKVEIKVTESLAAPLIESTRREYEQRLAQKEGDITERETSLRSREEELSKAREAMEDQVAEKVRQERATIVAEEAKKAKLVVASELDQNAIKIAGLQEIVNERELKLAEAQSAQAELMSVQTNTSLRSIRGTNGPGKVLSGSLQERVRRMARGSRPCARRHVRRDQSTRLMGA
jgi:hypothetical protein